MSPGKQTQAYVKAVTSKALKNLPAMQRGGDSGRWFRTILGAFLLALGGVVILIQVARGVTPSSWVQLLPGAIPIAAGLFLIDPKQVVDAVKAGRKT